MPSYAFIVIVSLIACIAAATAAAMALRRSRPHANEPSIADRIAALETESRHLREANIQLARDLAVERERVSRIPELEEALHLQTEQLSQTADARGTAEKELAAARQACMGLEEKVKDLQIRLESAAQANAAVTSERDRINEERARAERALAEKSATLEEKSRNFQILQEERLNTQNAFVTARNETIALQAQVSALQAELEQQQKQAQEKLQILQDARESLIQQFKVLANDVMERHGDAFAKQNKQQIDLVLQPLREKLVEFQQGLQNAQTDSAKERAALSEQIRQLSEVSARMTSETTSLAQALRGSSQTQGAWGEMILASILERSGLRAGEEYLTQASHTTEDGDRLRPDVIVRLPGGQHVVIDAKVSLVAFEAFVGAQDDQEREESLGRHLESMRNHIRTLSSKSYHAVAGSSLDYVVMFVPIEGALAAALQGDPGLTSFAVQSNVAIATPTTLMIALRTIENVWKIERRNSNAEAIADRAGKMYDKFVSFIEDLATLGGRLDQAQATYRKTLNKLTTGPGNLTGQFEKLRELGARTNKALPAALLCHEPEERALAEAAE